VEASSAYIPHTSQNLGADSVTRQYFSISLHLANSSSSHRGSNNIRSSDDRSTSPINHDKWVALEERLRVVEGNNLTDLVLAAEVCLVPNIVVPKKLSAGLYQVYRTRMPEHLSLVLLQQYG